MNTFDIQGHDGSASHLKISNFRSSIHDAT